MPPPGLQERRARSRRPGAGSRGSREQSRVPVAPKNTPAAPCPLLPLPSSRSPPPATTARRSDSSVPGSRDATSGRLTPRYRLHPLPAAPFVQGRACREGRVRVGPGEPHPIPGPGAVGAPRRAGWGSPRWQSWKSQIGWRSRRWLGVEGKQRKDGVEFFRTHGAGTHPSEVGTG